MQSLSGSLKPPIWVPGTENEFRVDPTDPEDWPDGYPPIHSRRANLEWRVREMRACLSDRKRQLIHLELCRRDMRYWWAGWCWLFETRAQGEGATTKIPFIPFDYQFKVGRDFEDSITGAYDVAVPKSRDMGLSWITLLVIQHKWLFQEGFSAMLASKKEGLVDELGNMNTLFEKLRFNLKNLPHWMRPRGYDVKQHDKHLLLVNPERECEIQGTSTTGDVARSGRYNVVLIDEHAAIHPTQQLAVEASTSDAAASRWYISTPRGNQNMFFKKCHSKKTKRIDIHWTQHPYKGYGAYCEVSFERGKAIPGKLRSPWYDNVVATREQPKWMIEQELDISFEGSGQSIFDGNIMRIMREMAPGPVDTRWHDHRKDGDPALLIFEKPIPGESYILGCDPSFGTTLGSSSTVQIFKVSTLEQVAEYQGRVGIDILSTVVYALGREYNNAYLCIEANLGQSVINDMLGVHIDRTGILGPRDSKLNPYGESRIAKHHNPDGKEVDKYGIQTTAVTKPFMAFSVAEPLLRNQEITLRSKRLLSELSGFHQDGTKLHNPDGDDLVMGMFMALYGYWFMPRNVKFVPPFFSR